MSVSRFLRRLRQHEEVNRPTSPGSKIKTKQEPQHICGPRVIIGDVFTRGPCRTLLPVVHPDRPSTDEARRSGDEEEVCPFII